jgi:hypothetical protein
MKKIALLAFTTILFVSCIRKQVLVEPKGTLAEHANHCYNGVLDGDEISIDCGGECGPCNFATPSCSPGANKLKIGASNYTIAGSSCGTPSGQFEMQGSYIDGTLTIDLGENAPDVTAEYNIINSVPLYHEASVHLSTGSYGGLSLISGKVYFSQSGGKYIATVCNGTAYSFVTGQNYTITTNFSCP